MGVKMLEWMETILSRSPEEAVAGFIYLKKAAKQNKPTTMRWELQVEKVFLLPSLECILRVAEIMYM